MRRRSAVTVNSGKNEKLFSEFEVDEDEFLPLQNEFEKLKVCSEFEGRQVIKPTFIARKYVVVILKAKAERTSPAKRSERLTGRTPCFCATMKMAPRSIVLVE